LPLHAKHDMPRLKALASDLEIFVYEKIVQVSAPSTTGRSSKI